MSKEKNYQTARQCMIESQIHPMGVVSETILQAFHDVPREKFVPEAQCGVCYCDEDIKISQGRYLMEPSVFGRMLQFAKPNSEDVVLTIGSGAGYNAAVLSHLVSTVVALDEDREMLLKAQAEWDNQSCSNVVAVIGPLAEGAPKNAPYDLIIFNGAVAEVPQEIKSQLSVGGRMIALIKKAGQSVAKATLIEHIHDGAFSERVLFDAGTPYLQGFEPKKEFVF